MKLLKFLSYVISIVGSIIIAYACISSKSEIDFSTDVKPILNKHCISCHGGVKKSGEFSLLFEEDALAVTKSGKPAIIPGHASRSEFIKRLLEEDPELRMPYLKPQLEKAEIKVLKQWVNQGAKWGKHWAYSLPEQVEIPKAEGFNNDSLMSHFELINGIDHFIAHKWQDKGQKPNVRADKNILARRAALDITGLPPDSSFYIPYLEGSISYQTYVDSLFAQPSYGEKWASWWLDLARYADTKGYEKDLGRSIWPYRDWVIKALNEDLSFDQFTIEQLAGDLLPNPSMDQLIATGFHRNTMNNDEGGTENEEFRVSAVMDRVNTTFDVWQSTTMSCVQCHGHPYDPFRHEDYFHLMAFFNDSRDEDTPDDAPVLKFYSELQQNQIDDILDWIQENEKSEKTYDVYRNFLRYQEPTYKAHTFTDYINGSYDDHYSAVLWADGSCKIERVWTYGGKRIYASLYSPYNGTKLTFRKNSKDGEILGQHRLRKSTNKETISFEIQESEDLIDLYIEVDNANILPEKAALYIYWLSYLPDLPHADQSQSIKIRNQFQKAINFKTPTTPIMVENPKPIARTSQVFERGNWLLKSDTVDKAVPASLNEWKDEWSADRLGLAKWIVDKNNPLTARTIVNRVWQQIFGIGLVSTIEDMGTQSDYPTHPKLLDWLALQFMNEQEWSLKLLIKQIVLSSTYCQQSNLSPEMYQTDPDNKYYARGSRVRLSAEQIRDQALFVSGILSHKMYGPGVMPPQPEGVWQSVYNTESWVESKGEDRYRRALYTYLKRTSPYPSFITFDASSREVCTMRRTTTNTPLQALVTLNDPVYLEAAYHLARSMSSKDLLIEQLSYGYEKACMRAISPTKLEALEDLYISSLAEFEKDQLALEEFLSNRTKPQAEMAALMVVANAIMNLDEFLTKS